MNYSHHGNVPKLLCWLGIHKFGSYFYWHWMVCRECDQCGTLKVIL